MEGRRRRKKDYGNQDASRARSQYRKPPAGIWHPTVPSWEKKFCYVVGSIPWQRFLENKKFIDLYDNVLNWNDSAGEEAFFNAKNRFWAKLNGLPCDIPLPDPDIYIDKIDWNSKVDQELLLDLESDSNAPDDQDKSEQVVILGKPLVAANDLFSPSGWGDAEEDLKKRTCSDLEKKENLWECDLAQANGAAGENKREDCLNNSQGLNEWDNYYYHSNDLKYENNAGKWERWVSRNRYQESNNKTISRYRTWRRFNGDDSAQSNGKWGRGNLVH
ncbi:hypothetical protein NMG60_11001652 [Bertholletia excelsa]